MQFNQLLIGVLVIPGLLAAAVVEIKIAPGQGFSPKTVEIHSGDTVVFKNETGLQHDVTADPTMASDASNVFLPAGAEPFHSETLNPGDEFRHEFTTLGLYQYVCTFHEAFGMIGQVVVVQ